MTYQGRNEPIEFEDVEYVHETERAFIVKIDGQDENTVLPKSQIIEYGCQTRGELGTLIIPKWLADDRGLL